MSRKLLLIIMLFLALMMTSCNASTTETDTETDSQDTAADTETAVEEPAAPAQDEAADAPEEEMAEEETAVTEPVTLNFWSPASADPYRSAYEEAIAAFNESHPDIEVVHRAIENEQFFDVLRTAFAAGEEPDVFQHETHNQLWQFVQTDQVADITDWYLANEDRFLPGTEEAITWQGNYYGVPLYIHTAFQLYYNVDLLAEHGIDPASLETWDDYLAAFETLKEAGVTPIAIGDKFGWTGSQWFYAFLARTAGADKVLQLVGGNCGYQWTDPDIVRAAELYASLADNEYFSLGMTSDDNATAKALFFSGQAAFYHGGSWTVSEAVTEKPEGFNWDLNVFPVLADSDVPQDNVHAAVLGGVSISQKSIDEHGDAALTFLDYWSSPATQKMINSQTGDISAVAGGMPDDLDPLIAKIIADQLEVSGGNIPFLEHILPPEVGEDAIWNGGIGVLTGELTPQTWMESVQAAADATDPVLQLPENCE